ncbi:serine hydrolase domain-containing protein [Streptococcus dentasini]
MMKKLKSLITASLLALGLLASPAVQAEDKLPSGNTYDNIGSKIDAFVDKHKDTTAGMETAVFTADETLYEGHFGYMDKEKGIKADEGSVFEWGSSSKTVTWISVMQQVEAGRIDLKEDIRTYLPEGFLKNLKFDKPITMLDLMNHKAGFQETEIKFLASDYHQIIPLKDYLSQVQPPQVYEPGTVTAYSNWGTALAGYIVEEVTGQNFANYVKAEIFDPLGMKHTAIKPDLSDNAYVKKERARNQSYDTTGTLLGTRLFIANPYPAGSIISTLSDFKTYAQTLLKQEEGVLFDKKATWDKLFSASDVYAGSKTPKNRHGFWVTQYAIAVTEHAGNSSGYSNGLMLDLKNKVGLVVMTNQHLEQNYNARLPQLIFGEYKNSPLAQLPKDSYSGIYQTSRTYLEGPFSFVSLLGLQDSQSKRFSQALDRIYYKTSQTPDGRGLINLPVADFLAVPQERIWMMYGTVIAAGLAFIYSCGHLLVSPLVWFIRKLGKKTPPSQSKIWHHLLASLTVLTGLSFVTLFIIVTSAMEANADADTVNRIPLITGGFALISLSLLGLLLWRLFFRPKGKLTWQNKLHYGLTILATLATLWFIYFFDLYQWWVV